MISVVDALASLRPGKPCVVYGDDLSTVEWHAENVVTPSQAEVDAEMSRLLEEAEVQAAARQSGLTKIAKASGLTADELAALGL